MCPNDDFLTTKRIYKKSFFSLSFNKISSRLAYSMLFIWFLYNQSSAQSLYFPPITGNNWDTISPNSLGWCQEHIDSFYTYLENNNTKAFILLKDGRIVLEKYFGTHTTSSPWQWASAGKTITAFMIGITQQEQFLKISDTTSFHLGAGWTSCTPSQEEKITIRHQLTMTSGLDDNVADPFCTIDSCLLYYADAGTRWAYHNAPYTLLDNVIENATGMTLNAYTTQKLKTPTGMTGSFVQVGYNNVYFSTARSMARFGLLMLNKGNWNGTQIMTDTVYFNQMVNTSQQINKSYGYLWWLNGKSSFMLPGTQAVFSGSICPNAPADMIAAMGKDGQFLNISPSQKLVWIRMGNAPDALPVPYMLNDKIWEHINFLACSPSNTSILETTHPKIIIFPNPTKEKLYIRFSEPIIVIRLVDMLGNVVKEITPVQSQTAIDMTHLCSGYYFVKAITTEGTVITEKLHLSDVRR